MAAQEVTESFVVIAENGHANKRLRLSSKPNSAFLALPAKSEQKGFDRRPGVIRNTGLSMLFAEMAPHLFAASPRLAGAGFATSSTSYHRLTCTTRVEQFRTRPNAFKHPPNYNVYDIGTNAFHIRKFSPDGRFLVSFHQELKSVWIWSYRGMQSFPRVFSSLSPNNMNSPTCDFSEEDVAVQRLVKRSAWETLFKLRHKIALSSGGLTGHILMREFCMFTGDSKLAILVTEGNGRQSLMASPGLVRVNNESLPAMAGQTLHDYCFFAINLDRGIATTIDYFMCDRISMAAHVVSNRLAILSIQHQTIHVYDLQAIDPGCMGRVSTKIYEIGRFCRGTLAPIDRYFEKNSVAGNNVACSYDVFSDNLSDAVPAVEETYLSQFKQKVLSKMFEQYQQEAAEVAGKPVPTPGGFCQLTGHFMQDYGKECALLMSYKMLRIALLDENVLLIRLFSPDVVSMKTTDPHGTIYPSYYIFYDMPSEKILLLSRNSDEKLLSLYYRHYHDFRAGSSQHPALQWRTTLSVNQKLVDRVRQLPTEFQQITALRRTVNQIPSPCQLLSPSVYLDTSLFEYDSSIISPTDRVKNLHSDVVRFYSRDTMRLAFDLRVSDPKRMDHNGNGCGAGSGNSTVASNSVAQQVEQPQHQTASSTGPSLASTAGATQQQTRRQITYIFHPFDPLIVSMARDYSPQSQQIFINLHLYRNGFTADNNGFNKRQRAFLRQDRR